MVEMRIHRRHWRSGVIGLYTSFVLIALVMALGSLAVDLAHAQLAKTELRRAVDAATRAAAAGLATDQATAKSSAAAIASQNLVDGKPLTLNTATEISFGTWNSQDAVTISVERPISLIFGRLIGMNSCTITARATATVSQATPSYGVVGLTSINMSGNCQIDSYDSSAGVYSSSNSGDNVQVASNGTWALSGNSKINGDVYYRGSMIYGNKVSGSRIAMASDLSFPTPTLPSSIDQDLQHLSFSGNNTYTLRSGNYKCSSLNMSGNTTLIIDASDGPVNLYMTGSFSISGNAKVQVTDNCPTNFILNGCTASSISYSGNSDLIAVINAPLSSLNLSGNHDICGSVIVKSINMSGNNGIHYDQNLNSGPADGAIALVE